MHVQRKGPQEIQMQKILQEFPCMWAVQDVWHPLYHTVVVEHAKIEKLEKLVYSPDSFWVKLRHEYSGVNALSRLPSCELAAVGAFHWAETHKVHVEAIIHRSIKCQQGMIGAWERREYRIYICKKAGDLHDMCEKIAERNPAPKRKPLDWVTSELLANDGL